MDLVKYVNELNDHLQSFHKRWEPLQDKLKEIKLELLTAGSATSSGERKYPVVVPPEEHVKIIRSVAEQEQLKLDEENVKKQLDDLWDEAIKDFDQIKSDYEAAIKDFFTVKPADVDTSASILLSSGVLSDNDLCDLAVQYSENGTMLAMIYNAAAKRDSHICNVLSGILKVFKDNEDRITEFDAAVVNARHAVNPGEGMGNVYFKYWNDEKFQEAKNNVEKLQSLNVESIKKLSADFSDTNIYKF